MKKERLKILWSNRARPSNLFTQAPVEVVADGPPHPCDESDRQAQRQRIHLPRWKRILLPLMVQKSQTTTWDGAKTPVKIMGWTTYNLNWWAYRISEPSTVWKRILLLPASWVFFCSFLGRFLSVPWFVCLLVRFVLFWCAAVHQML